MKFYFFIINPAAAGGRALQTWEIVKKELDTKEVKYRSFFTEYPRHAEKLASQIAHMHRNHIEAIVAVGGDGTISEIVNGLADYQNIAVGFIPAGSGNDFARGYHIPKRPLDSLSYILKNPIITMTDVGKFQLGGQSKPQFFINSLGIGFDAIVSKITNQSKMKKYLNKFHIGSLSYVFAFLKALFIYKKVDIKLTIDGKQYTYQDAWFVVISNQSYYGGGMKISPSAIPTDGLLNVTVVRGLSPLKLLIVFASVFWGRHTFFKEVFEHKGTSIKIDSDQKLDVHADGEVIGYSPVSVFVQYNKLPLITTIKR